ncbi:MAG: hypothetical protein ABI867_17055 [Kofleriaceae bacterium]
MRVGLLGVCAIACSKPAPARPAPPPEITSLEVIVLDDYKTRESCDGIPAHRLEISLDGKPASTVSVPCTTEMRAPPMQHKATAFPVAPGKHVIVVRDADSGTEGKLELEFPVIDANDDLATKLPVWANEEGLELQGIRADLLML